MSCLYTGVPGGPRLSADAAVEYRNLHKTTDLASRLDVLRNTPMDPIRKVATVALWASSACARVCVCDCIWICVCIAYMYLCVCVCIEQWLFRRSRFYSSCGG